MVEEPPHGPPLSQLQRFIILRYASRLLITDLLITHDSPRFLCSLLLNFFHPSALSLPFTFSSFRLDFPICIVALYIYGSVDCGTALQDGRRLEGTRKK